ncbi:MerR family transcriptional regulator [Fulvimarina sp. 2208YS6-2-32]|uniref:MerR family transcriptional regulator n=1 Tax=Fulvimarina uroteuthidis TaxID=3098149 RepID=A0ABU5I481_9HYPH|nr:MerR family transcriptional regulator [Fulvimarina sp. 2208YS6-2-32]MDY8109614.1 MerR family transcriptional regulator [Fulvimarina sp. 2208YS6-2-32]
MSEKSDDAFKSIGEVATELKIPQHVLRFWETRFPQVRPLKRGGGRRYYRPEDVALLHGIRFLLYAKGFTIKGVQRLLREQGARFVAATATGELRPDTTVASHADAWDTSAATAATPDVPDDFDLTAPPEPPVPAVRPAPVANSAPDEYEDYPDRRERPQRRSVVGSLLGRRLVQSDAGNLTAEQSERLQEVIIDLLECKRLLDQVR